jgi:hypothetical protein
MDRNPHSITEAEFIQLADNMAASAASFTSHGYDTFIQARASFLKSTHLLFTHESAERTRRSTDAKVHERR